jgi:hypothetical protein
MSETSCATLAAAALAPQCDWADLDGPLLTTNNPYQMPSVSYSSVIIVLRRVVLRPNLQVLLQG